MKDTSKANNPETTTPETPDAAPLTREAVRAEISRLATAIGADTRKTITSEEYQVITAVLLERLAGVDKSIRPTILHVLKLMDANASAMRQRLYESKTKAESPAVANLAAKYAAL